MSDFLGASASSRRVVWLTASALLVLITWLAWRGDQGLLAEQEARHAAVAARVFDELERELSTLVAAEEGHPFLAWQGTSNAGQTARTSPLALLTSDDPRLGYVQWEPDGSLTSPSWAEDRSDRPSARSDRRKLETLAALVGPAQQEPPKVTVLEDASSQDVPTRSADASTVFERDSDSAPGNNHAVSSSPRKRRVKPKPEQSEPPPTASADPPEDQKKNLAQPSVTKQGEVSQGEVSQGEAGQGDITAGEATDAAPNQAPVALKPTPQAQQMQSPQQMQAPQQASNALSNLNDDRLPGDVFAQNSLNRGASSRQQRSVANVQTNAEELQSFLNQAQSKAVSKVAQSQPRSKGSAAEQPLGQEEPSLSVPAPDIAAATASRLIDVEVSPMQALLFSLPSDAPSDSAQVGATEGAVASPTSASRRARAPQRDSAAPAMVLWRTVTIERRRWRQLVAFDLQALEMKMESQVLGGLDDDLRRSMRLQWQVHEGPRGTLAITPFASAGGGQYSFRHAFAAPFGFLSLDLSMSLLADTGGSARSRLWALTGLVGVCVVLMALLLQRTMKRALAAAQERSDFVSAVTHELRTPLTSIRMYSEMLEQGMVPTDAKREEYARTIRRQSERLSRLVDSVLTFARIERGVASPTARAPLGRIVDEVIGTCESQRLDKGIAIRVDLVGSETLLLPHDALVQVLVNLVDNAIKFSPAAQAGDEARHPVPSLATSEQQPSIEIIARRNEGSVELRVLDRGAGVPVEYLDRIFRPFVRGERELTRETTGTGIGLALVAGLVKEAGGSVTARRRRRGGLEVLVRWPATGA